jgi:hypothetical protein
MRVKRCNGHEKCGWRNAREKMQYENATKRGENNGAVMQEKKEREEASKCARAVA